jgi:hypothetical protein
MAEQENGSSPLPEALARVGDRWTLLVVEALRLLAHWGVRHADPAEAPRHPASSTLLEARWYCPTCDHLVDHEPCHAEISYL